MNVIVCVDDRLGMMFNHRRQSKDSLLRQRILQVTAPRRLWMSPYSAEQFQQEARVVAEEDFLRHAPSEDFCFVEDTDLAGCRPEKILLYRWNRIYPSDLKLKIDLSEYRLVSREDFPGSSHEKITEEVYER